MLGDETDARVLAEPSRALHSDPHDFAGLYIRHRTAFTLHARRYLRDARDADEVVQEAFLRLFLALPELETELQALAYCRRTITNLCIDRYRAQARRPTLVDLGSIPLEELPDEDRGDPVVRAEDAALVREALSMLSPLHRDALVKREIEEKPLPVIAEELAVPEDSVKHLLFRARRALRRLLVGTSLEPGGDGEAAPGRLARAGSGGAAAVLALLLLGLSSGPDLQAIPVVGVDLPEIIPVTDLARSVGEAMTDVIEAVTPTGTSGPAAHDDAGTAARVAADPSGTATEAGPSASSGPTSPAPTAAAAAAAPAADSDGRVSPAPAPAAPAPDTPQSAASQLPSAGPSAALPASSELPPPPTGEPEPSAGPQPSEVPASAAPTLDPTPPAAEPTSPPARGLLPVGGHLVEATPAP